MNFVLLGYLLLWINHIISLITTFSLYYFLFQSSPFDILNSLPNHSKSLPENLLKKNTPNDSGEGSSKDPGEGSSKNPGEGSSKGQNPLNDKPKISLSDYGFDSDSDSDNKSSFSEYRKRVVEDDNVEGIDRLIYSNPENFKSKLDILTNEDLENVATKIDAYVSEHKKANVPASKDQIIDLEKKREMCEEKLAENIAMLTGEEIPPKGEEKEFKDKGKETPSESEEKEFKDKGKGKERAE
jgi:hypothetical protein